MIKNYLSRMLFFLNNIKSYALFFLFSFFLVQFSYSQNCSVNAGVDQEICNGDTLVLGNPTGSTTNLVSTLWEQISGPSVIIDSPNTFQTTVQGTQGGQTYVFRLTGTCTIGTTFQEVTVTVNPITVADAGNDVEGCPGDYNLNANAPATGEVGVWEIIGGNDSGVNIDDLNSPTSAITLPSNASGSSTLRWTITNPTTGCSTSSDVIVSNFAGDVTADAGTD